MASGCHSHDCGGNTHTSVHQTMDEMEFERGIWSAAMDGDANQVGNFLKKGINVDSEDSYGYTALHYASRNGHLDVCKLLLDHRANSNCETRAGKVTPLQRAANRGHLQVLKLLLKHTGDPAIIDADGKNALHKAAEAGQRDVIKFLIEIYPNLVHCRDNQGKTPKDLVSEKYSSILPIFDTS